MRVDPNPLSLHLTKKQTPLRASTTRVQSSGSCRPNARGGLRIVPRVQSVTPLSCWSNRDSIVSGAICTCSSRTFVQKGGEGRVGGMSCGPLVVCVEGMSHQLFFLVKFEVYSDIPSARTSCSLVKNPTPVPAIMAAPRISWDVSIPFRTK